MSRFKRLLLILTMSFCSIHVYSMQQPIQTGANAGLYAHPELNFDKVELGLEATDYLTESLKIATMGSTSENKLKLIYAMSTLNKVLITGKELWKLDLSELLEFNKYSSSLVSDQASQMHAFVCFGLFIKNFIKSWWVGHIDSLGVFKLITSFGYGIMNSIPLTRLSNIVKLNKSYSLQKLNREKLMQFIWLNFNKFIPIVIYTLLQLRKSDIGLGAHLFQTIGDEESKRTSTIYRYCSLMACISELLRTYRQARYTKIYQSDAAFNAIVDGIPRTS